MKLFTAILLLAICYIALADEKNQPKCQKARLFRGTKVYFSTDDDVPYEHYNTFKILMKLRNKPEAETTEANFFKLFLGDETLKDGEHLTIRAIEMRRYDGKEIREYLILERDSADEKKKKRFVIATKLPGEPQFSEIKPEEMDKELKDCEEFDLATLSPEEYKLMHKTLLITGNSQRLSDLDMESVVLI
ncbi:hypothetical protein OESDEN_25565 [Oesophagostomum dentatum]|uniref:Uncharacterized protein n=1 Tax=Oesophagostomum dentatum TaxID=61180 RepID=A0A0B1RQB4_OESDE|nr:hypothetical protein OESDEN_25565 [Oesophagostomum dentatum]